MYYEAKTKSFKYIILRSVLLCVILVLTVATAGASFFSFFSSFFSSADAAIMAATATTTAAAVDADLLKKGSVHLYRARIFYSAIETTLFLLFISTGCV